MILAWALGLWSASEVWADTDKLLEKNQQLRDSVFSLRATVVVQGTAGLPLPANRKYINEIQWLQKGDLIRVEYVLSEVLNGVRKQSPKNVFVYKDRTRTVFQTAKGGVDGTTNLVQIDPPHERVPPFSVWRLALFEFSLNRFEDPKGLGRISYLKAARSGAVIDLNRIVMNGPASVTFVLNNNATEELQFNESGLVMKQVTTNGSGEHRIEQVVTSIEEHGGIPFPRKVTTKSWELKRPGSPLVQDGTTEVWVHSVNDDVPDSEFAIPDVYPRTVIDHRDQAIRSYDKDRNLIYTGPARSTEQLQRDMLGMPPDGWHWWWIGGILTLLCVTGAAAVMRFRRSGAR